MPGGASSPPTSLRGVEEDASHVAPPSPLSGSGRGHALSLNAAERVAAVAAAASGASQDKGPRSPAPVQRCTNPGGGVGALVVSPRDGGIRGGVLTTVRSPSLRTAEEVT